MIILIKFKEASKLKNTPFLRGSLFWLDLFLKIFNKCIVSSLFLSCLNHLKIKGIKL
mgnify:FL=1|tara:strand:- start:1342 stop:1512 length:171 start_codon:yes stop_codon:yes gene_type:complete